MPSLTRIRTLAISLLTIFAFSATIAVPAIAGSPAAHAAKKKKHRRHHHSGIPQNGGGDGDADNFGGPSDGDGNV